MIVYRIARERYIRDLSGDGARRYGGRWNSKGIPLLYTAASRSLAVVEYLVHVSISLAPQDLYLAEILFPDSPPPETVEPERLPPDWTRHPAPSALAEIGDAWARRGTSIALKAPSAVVPGEYNYLLNPRHTQFK
ncbi:MAG TPA: RES domain-containing protein, partial [Spirochaetia bacterium]|nr:RES domain-containing protein [Spirochaetia bacterium]